MPEAASVPHYPGHLLPTPSKLRRICLRLISKPFLYLFFFQGRSNIFQMRQNRDGSEAFSAGACVSAGRGFCLCLGAFLPTARSPRFLPRNFEFCALSGSELLALSYSVFRPGYCSLYLSLTVSLWPSPPLPLFLRSLSVCLAKSLVPSKLSILLAGTGLQDHRRGGGPSTSPLQRPSRFGPASPAAPPARTWSSRPVLPPPLPSTRAVAGPGVLNRISRAPNAGPRAPKWPQWLPITCRSRPRPAPPVLQSRCRPRSLGSDRR